MEAVAMERVRVAAREECEMRHIALGALLLFGCASERPPFEAGQWELNFKISEGQTPVFWGGGGNCIDENEAADLPALLLSQTPLGQCTATKADYAGGKLAIELTCDGKSAAGTGPTSRVTLTGPYTASRLDADIIADPEIPGEDRELRGILNTHRVGECAAPDQGNAS